MANFNCRLCGSALFSDASVVCPDCSEVFYLATSVENKSSDIYSNKLGKINISDILDTLICGVPRFVNVYNSSCVDGRTVVECNVFRFNDIIVDFRKVPFDNTYHIYDDNKSVAHCTVARRPYIVSFRKHLPSPSNTASIIDDLCFSRHATVGDILLGIVQTLSLINGPNLPPIHTASVPQAQTFSPINVPPAPSSISSDRGFVLSGASAIQDTRQIPVAPAPRPNTTDPETCQCARCKKEVPAGEQTTNTVITNSYYDKEKVGLCKECFSLYDKNAFYIYKVGFLHRFSTHKSMTSDTTTPLSIEHANDLLLELDRACLTKHPCEPLDIARYNEITSEIYKLLASGWLPPSFANDVRYALRAYCLVLDL